MATDFQAMLDMMQGQQDTARAEREKLQAMVAAPSQEGFLNEGQGAMDLLLDPTERQRQSMVQMGLSMMGADPRQSVGQTISQGVGKGMSLMDSLREKDRARELQAQSLAVKGADTDYGYMKDMASMMPDPVKPNMQMVTDPQGNRSYRDVNTMGGEDLGKAYTPPKPPQNPTLKDMQVLDKDGNWTPTVLNYADGVLTRQGSAVPLLSGEVKPIAGLGATEFDKQSRSSNNKVEVLVVDTDPMGRPIRQRFEFVRQGEGLPSKRVPIGKPFVAETPADTAAINAENMKFADGLQELKQFTAILTNSIFPKAVGPVDAPVGMALAGIGLSKAGTLTNSYRRMSVSNSISMLKMFGGSDTEKELAMTFETRPPVTAPEQEHWTWYLNEFAPKLIGQLETTTNTVRADLIRNQLWPSVVEMAEAAGINLSSLPSELLPEAEMQKRAAKFGLSL